MLEAHVVVYLKILQIRGGCPTKFLYQKQKSQSLANAVNKVNNHHCPPNFAPRIYTV